VAGREDFPCPACGAPVRAGATSCRACGADERTGWAAEGEAFDEEVAQEVDLPRRMEDDEYDDFVREELEGGEPRPTPFSRSGVLFVSIAVLAVAILLSLLVGLGRK
jgi:uncharacterized Zn finger protein (UPF0148 family)